MDLTVIRILIDLFKTQNSNVLAILLVIMLYNTYRFSRFLYEEIKKRDLEIIELKEKLKEKENLEVKKWRNFYWNYWTMTFCIKF